MTSHSDLGLYRPWLSLYGNLLKIPSATSEDQTDLALIQKVIPNEHLVHIFGYLDPYSLAKASLVCRQWRTLTEHPVLWERACHDAFRLSIPDKDSRKKLMSTQYRFSWKRMYVHHPHLRFDGIYAGRNTYVRTGVVEFTHHRPVHLVSYFRYFRFLPDGSLLYRTSPNVISKVARWFMGAGPRGGAGGAGAGGGAAPRGGAAGGGWQHSESERGGVLCGRYVVKGSKVYCSLLYPGSACTELRCRLALRSTHPGANNRLDIEAVLTYDRGTREATNLQPPQDPDVEELEGPGGRAHSRGLAPCVFVPWEQVMSSPLNLPPHQMDFMIV